MSALPAALRGLALAGAALLLASPGLAPPTAAPPVRGETRAAAPSRLLLKVMAPEPVLRGGEVRAASVTRTYALSLSAAQHRELSAGQPERATRAVLEGIYARIEARRPKDALFFEVGNGWAAQAQTGWQVRRALTAERLRSALRSGKTEVTVALRLTAPERTVQALREQGVVGHLASGESGFGGSPDFRVHNIRVGGSRFQGLWLEPGAVLDFNGQVGNIAAERGFVPGYVIAGQSLTMEPGGGICQVSTTVFRAAYNAGLEIVERHAHSHQVAYYDPPGFEATVYAPAKNLRFRNDTASPLLMQTSWDLEAQTLSVHLFGGLPDREVQVSAPQISGQRPALAPTFMVDATVGAGETRRIDMPAPGMQVLIERTVRMKGERARTDQLRSDYRPWGGVFAVAPGDPNLR